MPSSSPPPSSPLPQENRQDRRDKSQVSPYYVETHGRMVSIGKMLCAVIALFLVSLIIAIPMMNPMEKHFKLTFSPSESHETSSPKMLNPRFQGIDSQNQPYNITADVAIQKDRDKVFLKKLNADITLSSGTWVSLISEAGIFSLTDKVLELSGMVNIFTDKGYEVRTPSATIELGKGEAYGNQQVEMQGPLGTLVAKGFTLTEKGNKIDFQGPVKVTVYPLTESN